MSLPDQAASPCINVCRMNPCTGLCEGCLRTLDEIAAWGQASKRQKLDILAQVDQRRAATDVRPVPRDEK